MLREALSKTPTLSSTGTSIPGLSWYICEETEKEAIFAYRADHRHVTAPACPESEANLRNVQNGFQFPSTLGPRSILVDFEAFSYAYQPRERRKVGDFAGHAMMYVALAAAAVEVQVFEMN